jgi:DNA methylase/ParB-like nuclease domain
MMLQTLKIADIKVGHRHRKDMGDLTSLAESIRQDGFLQPIGVTEKLELVFGERRLRAHRDILKKKTILARIVDVPSIIAGEYAENEIRKDFTPSERVAIAKAIEKQVGGRQGQRTDKLRGKIPEVAPGKRTREIASHKAGFGNDKTYRQAAKVVQNGTAQLIHAMDSGRVSISAASILADADSDEQEAILELDERAILQAAKEIRQRQTATRNHQQQEVESAARGKLNCKKTWKITADQKVVQCDLLLADPPYGITDEPWEPDDLESFTRKWCNKWSACGADFIAIFWSQENLFDGRKWFDESLPGYKFQQVLVWHYRNTVKMKNRYTFRPTWEPVFLYRRNDCRRSIKPSGSDWGDDFHDLDCHVSAIPRNIDNGQAQRQHPCQKPVGVMLWLINALTDPSHKVASPFCGVAPCGIAATQLGRDYHGIDTDAKYRKIAEGRIAAYGQKK